MKDGVLTSVPKVSLLTLVMKDGVLTFVSKV